MKYLLMKPNRAAFTLIELLVVIAIIAILVIERFLDRRQDLISA